MSSREIHSPHDVNHLLSLSPGTRSEADLIVIANFFKNYKFFKELTEDTSDKMIYKYMTLRQLKKDEILFKYGDKPCAFYFIISGSVDVYIPDGTSADKEEEQNDEEEIKLKKVSTIPCGGTFGELSLIAQRPRAATIKAAEHSFLAVCDRKIYIKYIKEKEKVKLIVTMERINTVLPFKLEKTQLMKLVYYFRPIEMSFNSIIYKEENPFTHLYIIFDGEVKVTLKATKTILSGYIEQKDQ